MLITITATPLGKSVDAGKRVVAIDGETLGKYAHISDAFEAVDAWSRAALGIPVHTWDYYAISHVSDVSETLAVNPLSLADDDGELDSPVEDDASESLDTAPFGAIELSRAYTVAQHVLRNPHTHSHDDAELKSAIRVFRYISRDVRVEGEYCRGVAATTVMFLRDALTKRASSLKMIRFSDGTRRVATLATISGRNGGASIIFRSRYDLEISIRGDVPFRTLERFIRHFDEVSQYVWTECTRIELAYHAGTDALIVRDVVLKDSASRA